MRRLSFLALLAAVALVGCHKSAPAPEALSEEEAVKQYSKDQVEAAKIQAEPEPASN